MHIIAALAGMALSSPQTGPPQLTGHIPAKGLLAYTGVIGGNKFTENKGQWDKAANFAAFTGSVDMWVTYAGIVYY